MSRIMFIIYFPKILLLKPDPIPIQNRSHAHSIPDLIPITGPMPTQNPIPSLPNTRTHPHPTPSRTNNYSRRGVRQRGELTRAGRRLWWWCLYINSLYSLMLLNMRAHPTNMATCDANRMIPAAVSERSGIASQEVNLAPLRQQARAQSSA